MNKIFEKDFEYIAEGKIPWESMKNKTVFITGGTGFLGGLLIRFFLYMNIKELLNIKLVVLVRDKEKAKRVIGDCNIIMINGDVCDIPEIPMDIDFIFHCAAVTNSKTMIEKPVEVTEGIVCGTNNIMKLASKKKVESVIYLSSMEIYGKVNSKCDRISEEDLGEIDILNVRSCYPLGKRMAENICFNYFSEYGVPVKIVRLAQTFGAGVHKTDNRVFAQFAKSVINEVDIVLHTDGSAMGNYCYSADAILGLFFILFKGVNGQSYNVVNEDASMTIMEMANFVSEKISHKSIGVKFDISKKNGYGYSVASKGKLSSDKMKKLGWVPRYNMDDMYKRMIEYIIDSNSNSKE